MTIRVHKSVRGAMFGCVAAAMILSGASPAADLALDAGGARLSEFHMRDGSPSGQEQWELKGHEASVNGSRVEMSDIELRLRLRDGSLAVVEAPHCLFNTEKRQAGSDRAIRVRHEAFDLTGKGYDIWADTQRVVVRREVTMTVRRGRGKWAESLMPARQPGHDGAKSHEPTQP